MANRIQNTLTTSPLSIPTANPQKHRVMINVLNVSKAQRNGTLELRRLDNTVMAAVSYNGIAPGVGTGNDIVNLPTWPFPITPFYGRVTVDGPVDSIRASVVIADDAGNVLVSVEAR
jgi:hypothetical protein